MRDLETTDIAMTAAETGHLVLSTLHTVDASETINRVISLYPPHQQQQARLQLITVLKGVISQRLLSRADGQGMVPAIEILIATARVRELIADPKRTREIHDAIASGRDPYGMISFDQSLTELVLKKMVTYAEASAAATNPADFALHFRGVSKGGSVDDATGSPPPQAPGTQTGGPPSGMQLDRFKE
jgi:twitching motility protein PilT